MSVKDRRIINKGVLERPGTKWKVLRAISRTLKFQECQNHEILLFHYSVRQKIGDPGPISMQNMFPLLPVTPKRPELPYGAKYLFLAENPVFQFFPLLVPIEAL